MKGRILGSLFALPFFSVGVWMLWSVSTILLDAWDMRSWQPTPATLTSAGYNTNSGDDSDTYEAYASYTYSYLGQALTGNRVNHGSGADNIGDYQQQTGRQLSTALARGQSITILVNPSQPNESIIDASIRWGMVGFKSIFLFVFGGVGLGLLIFIWRAPKDKDETLPEFEKSPWLLNHDWQVATIRSSSKTAMWGAWVFAAIWSLISSPMPFMAYREVVDKQNYLALAGLLFPVIGVGLIVWAIKRTREWRRFGPTPVALDPFPGSIGGHVGGTIDMNLPFAASNRFLLTLTSIHSYISGSGKNRSRKERANWQEELVAHTELSSSGTRVTFRFDVPSGEKESDAKSSGDSYDLWRLNLRADIPGTDLDRDFEIPVYATSQQSLRLSAHKVAASERESDAVYDEAILDVVNLSRDGSSTFLHYPMGRNAWSNLAGLLIGGVFAAIGAFLMIAEQQRLFGAIFGGVGALVAISAFYMLFKSLLVTLDRGTITSVRRVLGIPIRTRDMRRDAFFKFDVSSGMQSQSSGKHTVFYKISAVDRSGNKVLLGDGFKGKSQAEAAQRLFAKELGLFEKTPAANDGGASVLNYTTAIQTDERQ